VSLPRNKVVDDDVRAHRAHHVDRYIVAQPTVVRLAGGRSSGDNCQNGHDPAEGPAGDGFGVPHWDAAKLPHSLDVGFHSMTDTRLILDYSLPIF